MLGSFRRRGCSCKKKRCTCGSKWHYRYDVIDPQTGNRKQKETRGFETKQEVEEEAKKILAMLQQGTLVEEKNTTFKVFSELWLEHYKKEKVKISTIHIRETKLKIILNFFGHIKMKDISKSMYQSMLDSLAERYARKTISSVHETGSLIFKKAMADGVVSKDITLNTVIPTKLETVEDIESFQEMPKYLEKEELIRFLDATKSSARSMDYVMYTTLAYTGIRVGELCALKKRDIDFENHTIDITKNLYTRNNNTGRYVIQTPKTKRSRRKIDVDEFLLDVLITHFEHLERYKDSVGDIYQDEGFIFINDTLHPGYPIQSTELARRMKRFLIEAGLNPKITPHSLRHTHTSLLAEAGVSLETIQDRLGHYDDVITKKVYLHVTKPLKKEASRKFGELMRGI